MSAKYITLEGDPAASPGQEDARMGWVCSTPLGLPREGGEIVKAYDGQFTHLGLLRTLLVKNRH